MSDNGKLFPEQKEHLRTFAGSRNHEVAASGFYSKVFVITASTWRSVIRRGAPLREAASASVPSKDDGYEELPKLVLGHLAFCGLFLADRGEGARALSYDKCCPIPFGCKRDTRP
jgi:hypothetical protein